MKGDHKGRPYTGHAMPTFIGLDLAWTTKNESGICWLEGDSRENLHCTRLEAAVRDTETLADEVGTVDGPLVVTIDAPVRYSPERDAERKIASIFGRYKAGPHQAHYAVRRGYTAGIDLGHALTKRGFNLDPGSLLGGARNQRWAVEVFPHTIHVRLFDLEERILYKKGRVAQKRTGLQEYQGHLQVLLECEAPNLLDHPDVEYVLDPGTAQSARGKSIKRLDDTLDGLTCAIAAWLIWKEPERWEMIGDLNGYIVVPRDT